MLWLLIFSTILGISQAIPLESEEYGILSLPLYFEKSVYRAKVIDNAIELLDGPVNLENCYSFNFNVVAIADQSKYYIVPDTDIGVSCHFNCSICFSAYVREEVDPREVLYDTITLEAHTADGITSTTIIIVYSSEYDPYKLVYNINGTEYVILNYSYFKIFLLIVITTGLLLLIFEIREIVRKHRKEYTSIISDEINYI